MINKYVKMHTKLILVFIYKNKRMNTFKILLSHFLFIRSKTEWQRRWRRPRRRRRTQKKITFSWWYMFAYDFLFLHIVCLLIYKCSSSHHSIRQISKGNKFSIKVISKDLECISRVGTCGIVSKLFMECQFFIFFITIYDIEI